MNFAIYVLSFEDKMSLPNIDNKVGYFTPAQYYICIGTKGFDVTKRVNFSMMESLSKNNYELINYIDKGEYEISVYRNWSYSYAD